MPAITRDSGSKESLVSAQGRLERVLQTGTRYLPGQLQPLLFLKNANVIDDKLLWELGRVVRWTGPVAAHR